MNFDFSDEQKQLRDEARKLLAKECPTSVVRAVLDDRSALYSAGLWSTIAAQGWLAANIPEEFGGLGLGHLELCCIAEELGRALAPVPFASTAYMLTEALLLAGSDEQKQVWLPRIVAGEVIGASATSERPGPVVERTVSSRVENGKLTGTKVPVTDGMSANLAMVLAIDERGPGLFLVELHGSGIEREPVETVDPSRDAARIAFTGAAAERLGPAGTGFDLHSQLLDRAAVLLAFEQVGAADAALDMAKEYALTRHAFSRPIASYQAIKHKLADVYIKNALARSNAYHGAWALQTNAPELPMAAAKARVSASEACWFAAKENLHVHGGMGFTWEFDCHLFYRRAMQLSLVVEAPRVWKQKLIDRILQLPAAA